MGQGFRSVLVVFLMLVAALGVQVPLSAAPPQAPNLLANIGGTLYELTPAGQVVQTIPIPQQLQGQGVVDYPRDLVLDRNGAVYIYNGTATPYMSRYDSKTGTWAHLSYPGWSTGNHVSAGGIAVWRDYVYVTDQNTPSAEPGGIVRFNLANGTAARFLSGWDFHDLTLGMDGFLYALSNASGSTVVALSPFDLSIVRTIPLPVDVTAIAAGPEGDFYGVELSPGKLDHFAVNGKFLKSLPIAADVGDIDLSSDGRLVISGRNEQIFLTDTALNSVIQVRPEQYQLNFTWAAFVEPTVADLSVAISASPVQPEVDGYLQLVASYANGGPTEAPDATLVVTLDPNVRFYSADVSGGSWTRSGNVVTFRLGRVVAGSGHASMQLSAIRTGTITNTARIFHTYPDPVSTNDSAITTNEVVATRPPSALFAEVVSGTSIQLTWINNSRTNTGFEIERRAGLGNGTYALVGRANAGQIGFLDAGLAPRTRYTYRVRAISAAGPSAYSNEVSATTDIVAPAAPTELTATAVSSSRIDLAWKDGSNLESGFRVERKVPGGTFVFIGTSGQDEARFTDPNRTPNTAYVYRVRAENAVGNSDYSNEASALTWPAAPSDLRVTTLAAPAGSSQLALTWTDSNTPPTEHQLQRSGDGGTSFADLAVLLAGKGDYLDTGLTPGKTYVYRARSRNASGSSEWTSGVTGATLQVPPAPPRGLAVQALSSSTLRLTWTDASDNEAGFRIERKVSTGQFATLTTVAAGVTNYDHAGLQPQTTVTYRLVATNGAGDSPPSAEAMGTTLPLPPGAPSTLTAQAGDGQVSLKWAAVAGASSFNLYRGTRAGGEGSVPYLTGLTGTAFVDGGLTNGTRYYYQLTATGTGGEGARSPEVSAVPQGRPGPPSGLTATPGNGSVRLEWTASPAATGYRVKRAVQASGPFQEIAGNVTLTDYTDTGLTNGTTYYYVVAALSPIGASEDSAPVSATPQAPEVRPTPPYGLSAEATAAAIRLKWRQSATPGVTQNRLYRATRASGPYAPLVTLPATTTYTDRSAKRGVSYFYAVTALSKTGLESLQSNRASAKRR